MADLMKILQQAQQMQGRMQQMQEELQRRMVTGTSGGGMVTVEADGAGAVRRIKIDPGVMNPADVEMLEDLIVVALADAHRKVADAAREEMGKVTGGLELPFPLKLPF